MKIYIAYYGHHAFVVTAKNRKQAFEIVSSDLNRLHNPEIDFGKAKDLIEVNTHKEQCIGFPLDN